MKMRWIVLAVVMLVAAGVVAGIYLHRQHDRGTPYLAPAPQHNVLTLTARSKNVCVSSDGLPTPKLDKLAPRVWVDPDPVSALVLWRPGPMARPCKARLQHLDKARATAFALAVEKAPLPSAATPSCGYAGPTATVFLTYKDRENAEVVRAAPTGCGGGLSAPGRLERQAGAAWGVLGPVPAGIR